MARRYRIEVVVDPSNARAGTQEVRRGLRDATDDARRMGRAITLAFAALGAAGGLAGSTRLLASFGQAMSTVEAVTNSTRGEFRELNAEAQRLGANTRFSATQAAEGMIYLARAGFDANEVLGATEGTLQLAQAGALGLGEAADIASNILQGFRLQVDQTSRVVDVLALAANSSNTDVTQLGDAMAYVAPVAAGLGLQIEETAAAIGALSNAGLQGSMAGTGLRRVLSELESPSQKSRDILASMGVTADEVRISQVGLTAALQRLAEAGIDTGQALEIFGDRGGPAFEVLASSIPDVVRMTEAFNDAEGTAERIANTMDGNLNGAMLRAKSAAEALVLTLGELGATEFLTGAFRGTAGLLSDVVSVLNQTEGASVALEITLKALATTAGVLLVRQIVLLTASVATSAATAFAASGTYTLFTITLARYGAATAVAATASHAFGVAMRFMLGPIGLVIIAIGTLTALWASYRDVAQQARDANQDLYDIQNQVAEQARSVTRLTLQQAEARLVEARATRQQRSEERRGKE